MFVSHEAGMVIIPDQYNFPIPFDANPERTPVANGATTFGAILVATGAAKNPSVLLCANICDFDISLSVLLLSTNALLFY